MHRSGYPREIMKAAVELAGLRPDARVVEVGSGTGKLTEEFVACGLRVDAVEPGSNMVEVARRRVSGSDLVRFHLCASRTCRSRWGCSRRSFRDRRSTGSTRASDGRRLRRCSGPAERWRSCSRSACAKRETGQPWRSFTRRWPDWHPRSQPSITPLATWRRSRLASRRAARTSPRSGRGSPIPASQYRKQRSYSDQRRSPLSAESRNRQPRSYGRCSRRPRSTTASRPKSESALKAEDDRIIERAGGTLRSTQLVALVTASKP